MKRLVLAATTALVAFPLVAQERMTRTDCQDGAAQLVEMFDPNNADWPARSRLIRVTPDGYCQIKGRDLGNDDTPFDSLEWRMEDGNRWLDQGIPPLALDIRIVGLDPDKIEGQPDLRRPDYDVNATLRQEPDAGLLILERLHMANDAGDALTVSGVFERVFLSSPSMMQVSMGAAAFKAGLISMTLEGTHEDPFGFAFDVDVRGRPEALRSGAFGLISQLPDGVMDDESRAELTAFAGDLPKPVGTLDVVVGSERGLGLMQIMMFGWTSVGLSDADESGGRLDLLLDGISIDVDWSPAAQVAD